MDDWRDFFLNSGTDIWTLIEQAIIVAATDHSSEFKARRSEIAETLFSRSLLRSPSSEGSCGKVDVRKASMSSALTNEGSEVRQRHENIVTHHKMERRVCDSAALAASSASVSMATDTTIGSRQDNEGRRNESTYPVTREIEVAKRTKDSVRMTKPKAREEINIARKCDERALDTESGRKSYQCGSSENHLSPFNSDMSYKELVCIKETLQQQDQNAILDCLERLESMRLSLEMLKLTEIGKHVNSLRKHESDQIRSIVKRLVRNWKGLVDVWVECGSQVSDPAISGSNDGKQGSKERVSEQCQNVIEYSSAPMNDTTFGSLKKTSVEMPKKLFSFLKGVFPDDENQPPETTRPKTVKDDSSIVDAKSETVTISTSHPHLKERKTSSSLVFKVPKKKEINGDEMHSGTGVKTEKISHNSMSLVLKSSIDRLSLERSHDFVPDSRGTVIPMSAMNNTKLSTKAPTEKVDLHKRKRYGEEKQAEKVKKQCMEHETFEVSKVSTGGVK